VVALRPQWNEVLAAEEAVELSGPGAQGDQAYRSGYEDDSLTRRDDNQKAALRHARRASTARSWTASFKNGQIKFQDRHRGRHVVTL